MTTASPRRSEPGNVPLAIWPVAQISPQQQRADQYLPGCARHPAKMLPELARRIVEEYSAPGDLVVDPLAGIGTTVAEAARLGRRAIGIECEKHWVDLARENLDGTLPPPAHRRADIRQGDARRLAELIGARAGNVDLIVTSPPYGPEPDRGDDPFEPSPAGTRTSTSRYTRGVAKLGDPHVPPYAESLSGIFGTCFASLRPGGRLVVVTKNSRHRGRTIDLCGLTITLARAAGFTYLQHVIALHATIRDGELVARPSSYGVTRLRHARSRGEPAHLVAHEDVTVFIRPSLESPRAN